MNLWIGTSGFQYPEWKGTFYPEKLPASKMLPYYAERFATTEVNYSFRRIPSSKTIESWDQATPIGFKFTFKAPQKVTHFARLRGCDDTLDYFHRVVSALGPKLGAILFQLPPVLQKDAPLLESFLVTLPAGMRAAFEFRHLSWFDDEVFALLLAQNAGLCIADSAKLATPFVRTANFGYLRLRREDYTESDIARWAETLRNHEHAWDDAFVYFKHEESGVGPKLATRMIETLAASGLK